MKVAFFIFTFWLLIGLDYSFLSGSHEGGVLSFAAGNAVPQRPLHHAEPHELGRWLNRGFATIHCPNSSTSFRCQRPLSSFPDLQDFRKRRGGPKVDGKTDEEGGGKEGLGLSSFASQECDFKYFKVVQAKVEVTNCTVEESDEEQSGSFSSANPSSFLVDGCTATVALEFEVSPQLDLLLAYQYENSSHTPFKMAVERKKEGKDTETNAEEDVRMMEEGEDIWRYSLSLFHTAAKGAIHYKGYDQNGYSMCCDLFYPSFSSVASPSSTSSTMHPSRANQTSFCAWHPSSFIIEEKVKNENENRKNVDDEEEEGSATDSSMTLQARYVLVDKCPLPQTPSPTATPASSPSSLNLSSSEHTASRTTIIKGVVRKPLPAFLPGEWLAKVQLWRTRYGAWRKRKEEMQYEYTVSSTWIEGSTKDVRRTREDNERTSHENGKREVEIMPFMQNEENVEMLGRVVIPFHVDDEEIGRMNSNRKEKRNKANEEDSQMNEEVIKENKKIVSSEGNERNDAVVVPTSVPKTTDENCHDSPDSDL